MTGHTPETGAEAVRAGIKGGDAIKIEMHTIPAEDDFETRKSPFRRLDAGIFLKRKGDHDLFICGPLNMIAETRDQDGSNWGILLRWEDRDKHPHEEVFPRSLIIGDGNELRSRLADGGLSLNPSSSAKAAFLQWLSNERSTTRATTVTRIGWHNIGDHRVFMLPDGPVGDIGTDVVLQAPDREPSLFGLSGTLKEWRETIGYACKGNSRLTFAVSCAFAAPLLDLMGEDGGGISFKGDSRLGKSTALRVAASVCGGTPQNGAGGFIRSWRSTGNAIEAIAVSSCDCLLALDEMGQLDPKEAGEVAYMLANGQGKARSSRSGNSRPIARFRVLFLSTGEKGLTDLNQEAGKMTKAGQEVRFADLPADAGCGYGLFETLGPADTADEFAQYLKAETGKYYGTPFRAFLEYLSDTVGKGDASSVLDEWRDRIRTLTDTWLSKYENPSGQVISVARRFAMIALAGELATSKARITGWDDDAPSVMARICFEAWLTERGTVGRREEEQAVACMRDFLTRHGIARLEIWEDPKKDEDGRQATSEDAPPANPRFNVQNRAGWRKWQPDGDKGHWRYYLTSQAMGEALAGMNLKSAKNTLMERGFLIRHSDRHIAGPFSPPGHPKIRLYEIDHSVLSSDAGDH